MEFTIARSDFLKSLQRVVNVIPAKTTQDILYNVLLIAENNQLRIIATDLDIAQIAWASAKTDVDGAVAIQGKLLLDILREMPDIDLHVSVDSNLRVTIKTDSGEYKLSGQTRTEFPSIPVVETDQSITLSNAKLKRMIEKTIFACSTENLRSALGGVLCQIFENEYRMVSTDGHRLVRIINKKFSSPDYTRQFNVPTKALNFVARNLPEDGEHQVYLSEDYILFDLPNTKIYSRLIKEPFPDYDRVIPDYFEKEILVNREQLIHSVKRVSLFSNPLTSQIYIKVNADHLNIYARDIDFGGEANETISCRFDFEPLLIAYNGNYLLDILRHIDTDEVIIKIEDSDGPGLFFPAEQNEDEDLLMLLMPVRLSETD
ncbi:DNA polymerase III subunit beta [candidate division KSB1 bacterium]|nr:MAG: DNA polymerase III subunit beta [candidate division KSB1 bacterium]